MLSPKMVHILSPPASPPPRQYCPKSRSAMEAFCCEVEDIFKRPLEMARLHSIAAQLRDQFQQSLHQSDANMLPSFNHTLPSGREEGSYLALDVGGSTLRVALIELSGRAQGDKAMTIAMQRDVRIDDSVKALKGRAFFSWMADRIRESLKGHQDLLHESLPLATGIAWSFPVEQRSIRDGKLLQMGKSFSATDGLIGENLADLVSDACQRKNLNISIEAIVNDSSASLLSQAYMEPATQMSLILGTGLNAALHLPVSAFSSRKFGERPAAWHDTAHHVIVNTELSMFGRDAFPISRWDQRLKLNHAYPDYQPLEHLTSGLYLGEIARIILMEAIQTAGLFDGEIPRCFEPYALRAETLAVIEADTTPRLHRSLEAMLAAHPLPSGGSYSYCDLQAVRRIAEAVSSRAAAFLATSVFALWTLRLEEEHEDPAFAADSVLGCNGSVMDKYPSFCNRVQTWLDILTGTPDRVRLEMSFESVLLGAAVAVCCQGEA